MEASLPRPADGLEVFVVEDGYVVHDDAAGRVHHLNLTSALVFDLCDGRTDPEAIAAEVAAAFEVADMPLDEVLACIDQLTAEGVLRVTDEPSALRTGPVLAGPALTGAPMAGTLMTGWPDLRGIGWTPSHLRRLTTPATLVDVGVAAGTPPLHEAFPDARLVLVEPLVEWEPDLERLVSGRARGEYVLAAAGSAPGTRTINVEPRLTERSSFFEREPFEDNGDGTSAREVPVITLDSLLADLEIESPIGLKIDTEGWEHDVLLGATELLERTAWVIAEVSLDQRFAGRTSFVDLVTLLAERGFEVSDVLDVGRSEITVDATFVDLVFTRRPDG